MGCEEPEDTVEQTVQFPYCAYGRREMELYATAGNYHGKNYL